MKKIALYPQRVVTTQEVLTPFDEKLIASSFEQNVYQLYQCAEGWLGVTCEFGTLHLDEDQYYIEQEWIDETKHRFIPVITSLNRFVQPLMRYRMEDILTIKSNPCPCGNTHLAVEKIVGRCEDMLYFSNIGNSHNLKPIYSDNILSAMGLAGGSIEKYQLMQYSPGHLLIKVNAKNITLAKQCIKQQFEKLSQIHQVKCPLLEFAPLDKLPLNHMFRQTQRLVKIS